MADSAANRPEPPLNRRMTRRLEYADLDALGDGSSSMETERHLERANLAETEISRLRDCFERISRSVSWCSHGEADRGETLAEIEEITNEALAGPRGTQR